MLPQHQVKGAPRLSGSLRFSNASGVGYDAGEAAGRGLKLPRRHIAEWVSVGNATCQRTSRPCADSARTLPHVSMLPSASTDTAPADVRQLPMSGTLGKGATSDARPFQGGLLALSAQRCRPAAIDTRP